MHQALQPLPCRRWIAPSDAHELVQVDSADQLLPVTITCSGFATTSCSGLRSPNVVVNTFGSDIDRRPFRPSRRNSPGRSPTACRLTRYSGRALDEDRGRSTLRLWASRSLTTATWAARYSMKLVRPWSARRAGPESGGFLTCSSTGHPEVEIDHGYAAGCRLFDEADSSLLLRLRD